MEHSCFLLAIERTLCFFSAALEAMASDSAEFFKSKMLPCFSFAALQIGLAHFSISHFVKADSNKNNSYTGAVTCEKPR